jgi:hypothetical protein
MELEAPDHMNLNPEQDVLSAQTRARG